MKQRLTDFLPPVARFFLGRQPDLAASESCLCIFRCLMFGTMPPW